MTVGRRSAPGDRASLTGLLGEIPGYKITEASGENGKVFLKLEGPGRAPITVILGDWGTEPVFLRTSRFGIRYMGNENSTLGPSQEWVLREVSRRLSNVPLEKILKLVPEVHRSSMPDVPYIPEDGRDLVTPSAVGNNPAPNLPASNQPAPDLPVSSASAPKLPTFIPTSKNAAHEVMTVSSWAAPDRWRRFIFRREFDRNKDSIPSIDSLQIITVSHGESECNHSTAPITSDVPWIYNYPWVRPFALKARRDCRSKRNARVPNMQVPGYINTDLRDVDIITGGTRKLNAILDDLSQKVEPDNVVVVRSTCVPHVIGDDMEGSVRRWKGRCPIRYNDIFGSGSDYVSELLNQQIGASRKPKHPPLTAINVLGLPADETGDELLDMLREAGARINASLVPVIDIDTARSYMRAHTQVIAPNPYMQAIFEKVFIPLPIKTVIPPPPYGLRGTREWLRQAARAAGVETSMGRVWSRRCARYKKRLRKLADTAGKARLCFVISPDEYDSICDPARMAGIPVMDLLHEFGFGVDLFVFGDPNDPNTRLTLREQDATNTNVHWFTDEKSLIESVREAPCQAVYTDLHVDDRLAEAGKTPFSLQFFERGLAGTVRTVERLLGACAPNIYGKYPRHEKAKI